MGAPLLKQSSYLGVPTFSIEGTFKTVFRVAIGISLASRVGCCSLDFHWPDNGSVLCIPCSQWSFGRLLRTFPNQRVRIFRGSRANFWSGAQN
jgi:hypothetical protein